ncbi:MAG TPA: hypothetical protein VLZ03_15230 [Thermodesulfobacteriota bacterium]|nr:hypothetical protein [Thermodesulfobacteriota bacterium]
MNQTKARILAIVALIILISFILPDGMMASTDTKTLVIKANIGKVVKLIVDTNTITFPNIDPDKMRQVPALQGDIKVTVKARTGSTSLVTLNVIADGDLMSGPDIIPIQNVVWQASGEGFSGGTLSKSTLQTAGAWKGSGIREGVFRYFLNNSWNYRKAEYQVTVTYTLTTP